MEIVHKQSVCSNLVLCLLSLHGYTLLGSIQCHATQVPQRSNTHFDFHKQKKTLPIDFSLQMQTQTCLKYPRLIILSCQNISFQKHPFLFSQHLVLKVLSRNPLQAYILAVNITQKTSHLGTCEQLKQKASGLLLRVFS